MRTTHRFTGTAIVWFTKSRAGTKMIQPMHVLLFSSNADPTQRNQTKNKIKACPNGQSNLLYIPHASASDPQRSYVPYPPLSSSRLHAPRLNQYIAPPSKHKMKHVTSYSERWKPRSYHLQKVPPNLNGIYDNATSVIYDASFIEFSSRIVACFIKIDDHVFAKANVSICLFILLWQVATRTHTSLTIEQIQRPVSEDWPLTRHVDDVDRCLTCNNAASTRIYLQSVA